MHILYNYYVSKLRASKHTEYINGLNQISESVIKDTDKIIDQVQDPKERARLRHELEDDINRAFMSRFD